MHGGEGMYGIPAGQPFQSDILLVGPLTDPFLGSIGLGSGLAFQGNHCWLNKVAFQQKLPIPGTCSNCLGLLLAASYTPAFSANLPYLSFSPYLASVSLLPHASSPHCNCSPPLFFVSLLPQLIPCLHPRFITYSPKCHPSTLYLFHLHSHSCPCGCSRLCFYLHLPLSTFFHLA